jgi:hypothetical protein
VGISTIRDQHLQLVARRRQIRERLRHCPWPTLREQLQSELIDVADELLRLDCRRLENLRERLGKDSDGEVVRFHAQPVAIGEYDDGYCVPITEDAK